MSRENLFSNQSESLIKLQGQKFQRGRAKAIRLAIHYFKLGCTPEGHWDNDNRAEIEDLVDHIIEAAVAKATILIVAAVDPRADKPTILAALKGEQNDHA